MKKLMLFLLLFLPIIVFGEEQQTSLAVLDFTASKGVTEDEAGLLTDKFLVSLKETKKYKIMSRTEIMKLLKEQNFQLSGRVETEEAVKIGKILGVRNVVVGRMGKVGNTFLVIIQLIDVETSEVLKAIDRSYEGNVDQLISIMTELAYEIAGMKIPELTPTPKPVSKDIIGKDYTETYGGLNLEMVWTPGGTFEMGSPSTEEGRFDNEEPVHTVELDGFWIGKYEVTVGQFKCFVDETGYKTEAEKGDGAYVYDGRSWVKKSDASWQNPYFSQSSSHPVVCVSWNDAKAFCDWLSQKTGKKYTLPTEAQWEYTCRAGSKTRFCFGDSDSSLGDYAWYESNSNGQTHPVGQKKPNAFSLYDMHGNVWEWCLDKNPVNMNSSSYRVLRGGSWHYGPRECRSAYRHNCVNPDFRCNYFGFRVVRNPD